MGVSARIWMAAASVWLCTGASTQTHVCPAERGGTILQDKPCAVAGPPPAPPPALPCALTREDRSRAEKLEAQFLLRHADEASHRRAQRLEVQPIASRIASTSLRFAELARERKAIDDELAFYVRKPIPPDVARRIDANEAKFAALADAFRLQEAEVRGLDAKFACERATFGSLWRGGAPGSSGCAAACPAAARP